MSKLPEIFVPIKGYELLYEISNYGRVRALSKTVEIGLGRKQFHEEKIMKGGIGSHNYHSVGVQVKGKKRTFTTHRLVAKHFIKKVPGKNLVCHKDGNKLNNYFENLEWGSYSDNIKHAYDNKLRSAAWTGITGKDHPNSNPIIQYTLKGEFIKEWDSMATAARDLKIRSTGIQQACAKLQNAFGFTWRYKLQ